MDEVPVLVGLSPGMPGGASSWAWAPLGDAGPILLPEHLPVIAVGAMTLVTTVLALAIPAPAAPSAPLVAQSRPHWLGPVRRHAATRPALTDVLVALAGVVVLVVSFVFWDTTGIGAAALAAVTYSIVLYTVASRRPTVAWASFGVSMVPLWAKMGLTPPPVSDDDSTHYLLGAWLVTVMVLGGGALVAGMFAGTRHQHAVWMERRSVEMVAAAEQNARLASMQERSRIAREMHDVVAHSLSVMIALADGARAASAKSPRAAAEALDLLTETGRTALTDMRRMLGVLRDGQALMAPQPTTDDDVTGLVEVFGQAGLAVRLHADPLPDHPGLRLVVFRVVQEALTNVLRHAREATAADVEVRVVGGTVEVTVRDDGGPVDPARLQTGSVGKGLVGMRERAAMYAGEVEAGPVPGPPAGWQVHAVLTVPPPDLSVTTWVRPS